MKKISNSELETVTGGTLKYQGNDLDMNLTVADTAKLYPAIKDYKTILQLKGYWKKSLKDICAIEGEESVQNLINKMG